MSLRQVIKDPLYITYNREVKPESITALVKETIKALIERYDSLVTEHKELREIRFIDLITGKPVNEVLGPPPHELELLRRYEGVRELAQTALPILLQFDQSSQHMGEYLTIDHLFR